jgi:peptidoglycan hydrolase-like protein with peptidoglycan-binding domain
MISLVDAEVLQDQGSAMKAFQQAHDLTVDGIVGSQAWLP